MCKECKVDLGYIGPCSRCRAKGKLSGYCDHSFLFIPWLKPYRMGSTVLDSAWLCCQPSSECP